MPRTAFLDELRQTLNKKPYALESVAGPGLEREYVFFGKLTDPSQLEKADRFEDQEQWRIQVPATESGREIWVRLRKTTCYYRHGSSTDFGRKDPTYTLTIKSYIKGEPDTVEAESELPPLAGEAMLAIFQTNGGGMIKRRYFMPMDNPTNPDEKYIWEVDAFWPTGQTEGEHGPWVKLDLEVAHYELELTDSSFALPFPVELTSVVYSQPHNRTQGDAEKVKSLIKHFMSA